jgi:hypothetical protein
MNILSVNIFIYLGYLFYLLDLKILSFRDPNKILRSRRFILLFLFVINKMGQAYLEIWFWLLIIGVILFLSAMIGYEVGDVPDVAIWVWVLMTVGLVMIVIAIFMYIYKQRDCYAIHFGPKKLYGNDKIDLGCLTGSIMDGYGPVVIDKGTGIPLTMLSPK